jgi:hypothetical protein
MARLEHGGVRVELPAGWEGRISTRADGAPAITRAAVTVHAANFALPPEVGDFGGGAVEVMGAGSIFVALIEYGSDSVGTPLFRDARLPRRLDPERFHPLTLQRVIPGQSGIQVFFEESGRPFCLYVVLGSHVARSRLVRAVEQVLQRVEIS